MNPHEQRSSFIEKKQKFQPRPGSLDFGTNYEFLMAAYYGLALSLNVKVEDFKLSTNNKDMDNFDDVVLEIKFEDGEEHLYALQLKHRGGKEDNITLMSFTGDKGDHSLKKYCEGFKKVEKVCRGNLSYNIPFENFHFILYTNAFLSKFVTYDQNHKKVDADEVQLPKRPDMFIYKHDKCVAKDLINLCREESYFIYKFKTSKEGLLDGDFLNQFYLYTKQKNAKEMECFISKLIWSIFSNCDANVVTNYFNFFKNWWRGDFGTFKLTKQAVLLKLAEYVLTPHIPEVNFATFSPSDVKFSLLNECLSCFDLILIENSEGDEAEKVWKAILPNIFNEIDPNWSWNQPVQNLDKRLLPDGKKIPTSAQGENFIDQSLKKIYTILWHMDMVPMFVKVNNSYRKGIFTAMKLVQSQKKFIVQDENHIKEEFPEDMNIFRNLTDLVARGNVYGKICDELSVSLQGRQCVKLKELIDIDNRFLETISIKEILHMLDGNFIVGDNCKNNLPKHYVKRLTPKILLSIEAVDELTNDLFVIHCQEFNTLYPDFKLNTINFDKYILLNQDSVSLSKLQKSNKFAILANGETQQFREICLLNQNKNCHHVRVVDNKRIEWIETQGSVETLRLYQLNLNDFKDDDFVEDFEILNHFSSTINIICAEPGMGKSVLLKYLKYKCPTSHWVITVNLSDHISFFKELHQIEEVLEYFLNIEPETNFVRDVVKIFISQRKILFLWDAFDELPGNCLNSVVSTVKRLGENGYWQWIAARNNSKEFLESIFGLLSLTITQFSKQNQYDFIYNNLKERFEDENEVQLIVEKLNQNMSSSLNCGYFDYSGTPLQMYMVMEIFLKNPQKYLDEFKIVILTDIYQEFIEGKFESLFERANAVKKNPLMEKIRRKFKDTQLSQYEVAALKASFDEETFSILNLNCDKLLQELKENRDNLGIIFGMNNEKKPVFSHKTYEEFLTASWLVKNRDNHPHLVKMLFQENYKNIRLMFDMLLAKDSPVHIAVLYGNLDILEKRLDGIASIKDKGGRNPLHIACSWGSKHPLIDIIENNAEKNVISADGTIVHPNQNLEIVKLLLTHDCNPLEKDDLVNWSAVEYSDRTLSLSLIEVILAHNYSIDFEEMANFNDVHTLLYYSIKFYYPNLFFKLHRYPLIELRLEGGEYCSLLQFAVKMNRLDFVAKLLSFQHYQEVINVPYKDLGSCIFTAAGNGNLEMFNLLREKGANLDRLQISPLITSVAMGHKKLCQKLIEEGSSVNESNVDGNSVLQVAAMEKQIDIMKLFIENGADVNYVNNDLTALDYCVHNEMLEGVRLLVQNQANVNRASESLWGYTVLHSASELGNDEMVKFLIKSGADPTIKSHRFYTPLHVALINSRRSTAMVLIEANSTIIGDYSAEKSTPIMLATLANFNEIIKILAECGADVDSTQSKDSPLHIATLKGFEKCVLALIEAGASVNRVDYNGNPPLFYAVANKMILRLFLNNSCVDVNYQNETSKMTALHFASLGGQVGAVEELIKHGAKIDTKDVNHQSPLHYAIKNKDEDVVNCLLKHKTDIGDGSLLKLACISDAPNCLLTLLQHGIAINTTDDQGRTALHYAAIKSLYCVKILLKKGATPNNCDRQNLSPLCFAIFSGKIDIIKELVSGGADINIGFGSSTALHLSSGLGDIFTLILLLGLGYDINAQDDKGRTPLHCVAEKFSDGIVFDLIKTMKDCAVSVHFDFNHADCAKELIERGADITIANSFGWTPIVSAAVHNHLEMVELFAKKFTSRDDLREEWQKSFFCSASKNFVEMLRFLYENKLAEVNGRTKNGSTSLHHACSGGSYLSTLYLIQNGAEVNASTTEGVMPLYICARKGYLDLVKLLVEHQADINGCNGHGNSSLFAASSQGFLEIVIFLRNNGAEVHLIDDDGDTPLHDAAAMGHLKVVEYLVSEGAQIGHRNKNGKTALDLALDKEKSDIVDFLSTKIKALQQ